MTKQMAIPTLWEVRHGMGAWRADGLLRYWRFGEFHVWVANGSEYGYSLPAQVSCAKTNSAGRWGLGERGRGQSVRLTAPRALRRAGVVAGSRAGLGDDRREAGRGRAGCQSHRIGLKFGTVRVPLYTYTPTKFEVEWTTRCPATGAASFADFRAGLWWVRLCRVSVATV